MNYSLMFRLRGYRSRLQGPLSVFLGLALTCCLISCSNAKSKPTVSEEKTTNIEAAKTVPEMKSYKQKIPGTDVRFEMVPVRGGVYGMGSPTTEKKRKQNEGPQHNVKIEPFWMGKYEVTWDEYDIWTFNLDINRRKVKKLKPSKQDRLADAVTKPTKPYTDMTFDMGHDGYPAICMTQLAAKMYCKWLSAKTGHFYRLPTEAEWEYACRAGKTTAYSFGDNPKKLGDYAWYFANSDEKYHPVGKKKPNPWGLYDMHGNVSEWVLDQYDPKYYYKFGKGKLSLSPLNIPTKLYPRVVRGGSWDDDAEQLRSSSRFGSSKEWKVQDPQLPQSVWYHTDALQVGFRIVRPLRVPSAEEIKRLQLVPDNVKKERD